MAGMLNCDAESQGTQSATCGDYVTNIKHRKESGDIGDR